MTVTTKRHVYLNMMDLGRARKVWLDAFAGAKPLDREKIRVEDSLGRVTAGPVFAAMSSPREHLAAMDGLAVLAEKTFGARPGRPIYLTVGRDCHPVNTGNVLPGDCDAVIMIEQVFSDQGQVEILNDGDRVFVEAPVFPWRHVRKLGEDLVATELILAGGSVIGPYEVGALAAGGVYDLEALKPPRAAIIPSGDELISLDQARSGRLAPGDVVEFNSLILDGLVRRSGGLPDRLAPVGDDFDQVKAALGQAVENGYDLVLINAGSSSGTADHTANVIAELGEVLVHGVTIMPGKPTVLGRVGKIPVMGVPGYPVSAVIAFEQFARPLLAAMQGVPEQAPNKITVKPVTALPSKMGQEEFIRVKLGRVGRDVMAAPLHRGAGSVSSLTRADGVIRTGKLSEGVEAGREIEAELIRPLTEVEGNIIVIGSHDISLDILADLLRRRDSRYFLSSGSVGSLGGLKALASGKAHLAGSHLLDVETGEYNVSYIKKLLPDVPLRVVHLADREQGFIIAPGNPKGIKTLEDLAGPDRRLINRQAGSGTRVLLDFLLKRAGMTGDDLAGYEDEEFTHMNVAAAVLSGRADVGVGIMAAAKALGLDFIPLTTEAYQLVIPAEHLTSPKMETLLEVIGSDEFKTVLRKLGGYHPDRAGQVAYEQ